jgi:hypothetical protein
VSAVRYKEYRIAHGNAGVGSDAADAHGNAGGMEFRRTSNAGPAPFVEVGAQCTWRWVSSTPRAVTNHWPPVQTANPRSDKCDAALAASGDIAVTGLATSNSKTAISLSLSASITRHPLRRKSKGPKRTDDALHCITRQTSLRTTLRGDKRWLDQETGDRGEPTREKVVCDSFYSRAGFMLPSTGLAEENLCQNGIHEIMVWKCWRISIPSGNYEAVDKLGVAVVSSSWMRTANDSD